MNIVKKEETVNSAIVSMKILFDLNNGIYIAAGMIWHLHVRFQRGFWIFFILESKNLF